MLNTDLNTWTAADYMEAREIITTTRLNLGIHTEYTGRRMTDDEARQVYNELINTGLTAVAQYLKNVYGL